MSKPPETLNDASSSRANGDVAARGAAMEHIGEALRGLRFGVVSIVVQDGVVVQIERTERRRLR